jgi:hypothetical protein
MKRTLISFGFAVTAAASIACAQGTLTSSFQQAQASAQYIAGIAHGNFANTITPPGWGSDFTATENRPYNSNGFSGRGYADVGAAFTPANPGLGGSFSALQMDACSSAEVFQSTIGPHSLEESHGRAYGEVHFSISQAMNWTWIGVSQGTSYNTGAYHAVTAAFTLTDTNNTNLSYVNILDTTVNGGSNFFNPFSLGGVLPAGDYSITWRHESICTGGNTAFGFYSTAAGGAPLVSCIPSTFTLSPVPAPGAAGLIGLSVLTTLRRRRRA